VSPRTINRRDVTVWLGAVGTSALLPRLGKADPQQIAETHHAAAGGPPAVSAEEALARLKAGNQRFVSGKSTHGHEDPALRKQLASDNIPLPRSSGVVTRACRTN
jgi:hypothetical protein